MCSYIFPMGGKHGRLLVSCSRPGLLGDGWQSLHQTQALQLVHKAGVGHGLVNPETRAHAFSFKSCDLLPDRHCSS